MRVKITFTNGTGMFGDLVTEWPNLSDVMNDEFQFIKFKQPNGRVVMLNKSAIAYIVEDVDDYI